MSLPGSLCVPRWKNPQYSARGFYGSSPISLTALAGPSSSFPQSLLRCRKHSGQQSPPQTHTDPVPHSVTLGCSSKYRGRISLQYTPMAVILLETGTRGYWELVREQSRSSKQSTCMGFCNRAVGIVAEADILDLRLRAPPQSCCTHTGACPPPPMVLGGWAASVEGITFSWFA